MDRRHLPESVILASLAAVLRRVRHRRHLVALLLLWTILLNPFGPLLQAHASYPPDEGAAGQAAAPATTPGVSPTATSTSVASPTTTVGSSPTATSTSVASPTATASSSPLATNTLQASPTATVTFPPPPTIPVTPPPTYTIGIPTPAPTLTAIPDTNVVDQAIMAERDSLLAQVAALPALTHTITGTLVSRSTGGQITSPDGGLTLGMAPGAVATDTINVQMGPVTFASGDPRATRNGQPLAYTYALTATDVVSGAQITQFRNEVALVWDIDPAVLTAAGVRGFPLHVYTYNETRGAWEEVLSRWKPETHQLIATTPHFSLYSVGSGFDKVNNYVPTLNGFETDLQSGTASVNYPINVPAGPAGLGPKVALSYSSGNVDRVDASQQGTSPIGWGWSLSTSYVAATQHHFAEYEYHPWTVSIVSDGANGDLIKGTDGYWHTAQEGYARVQYFGGSGRTTDWWEAWGKDGTHYIFDLRALILDDNDSQLTTSKWMLRRVEDLYGNVVDYSYKFQDGNNNLSDTPPTGGKTRAVYPRAIDYGADGNKTQVLFNVAARSIQGTSDISTNDTTSDIYQSYRIDKIEVKRRQEATNNYALLRSYEFTQTYSTMLYDADEIEYPHLTLEGIRPRGNDGTTQLPSTTFSYFPWDEEDIYPEEDAGHLWWARNGYGGEVGFYYDAADGDVNSSSYRRVRARVVRDGLGTTPPHSVTYRYTYRGARENDEFISSESAAPKPLHNSSTQFRGFGWAQVQDPMGQVVDHYYSQDDGFKAKEWRVQTGKAITHTTTMDVAPTQTPNSNWTVSGDVYGGTDPEQTSNGIWQIANVNTTPASVVRTTGVSDGTDTAVRLQIHNTHPTETPTVFSGTWMLENANNNGEYWGLQLRAQSSDSYEMKARVVWGVMVNGTLVQGSRNVSVGAPYRPQLARPFAVSDPDVSRWYRLRLHTSPDGRFALEMHRESTGALTQEPTYAEGDYIQAKAGDLDDNGAPIPTFPTGQTWRFKHLVTQNGSILYRSRLDDYSETRTVYSQSDSVYSDLTATGASSPDYNKPLVRDQANNCSGMTIRFVPLTETSSTIYGAWSTEPGQVRRTKTTYGNFDSYGNGRAVYEYGDLAVTGDERSTHSNYAALTTSTKYIVDRIGWTNTYSGIVGNIGGANHIAQVLYYYDNESNYDTIPSNGKGALTKVKQVGILAGSATGEESAQQFRYDAYGNQDRVTDPRGNYAQTIDFDSYYHSFPITTTYANGTTDIMRHDYTLDVPTVMTDVNGTRTEMAYDKFGRPLKTWTVGFGTESNPNDQYSFRDYNQASVTPPFYISYQRLLTGTTTTWQTRWYDGRGRTLEDVSPKDGSTSIVVHKTYTDTGSISTTSMPYTVANANPTAYPTPDLGQPKLTKYYDGIGRDTMVVNPDGTTQITSYFWLGWVATQNETATGQTWQHTDGLGRVDMALTQDIPANVWMETVQTYDLLDHLTRVDRAPNTANWTWNTIVYDGLGRKSEMYDADMGHWRYFYDAAGNLTKQADALYLSDQNAYPEHRIFFAYDNMNRISAKYYGDDPATGGIADVKYYYDNDLGDAGSKKSWGRLRLAEVTLQGQGSSKANGHGYEYDARGLTVAEVVTSTLSARTYTTNYGYDVGGRLISTTYPDPETTREQVTINYNTQGPGLPNKLTSNKQGSAYPVLDATYNARGQMLTLLQGSSGPTTDLVTTAFTYDDTTTKRGWLTRTQVSVRDQDGYDITRTNLTLNYAANGNVEWVSQVTGGTNNISFSNHYQYTGLDQLKVMTSTDTLHFPTEELTYDSLGRINTRTVGGTSTTLLYDAAHKDAPTNYGARSYGYDAAGNQITGTVGSQVQTRTFDAENRLERIVAGDTTSEFIYDANGQRLIKSVTITTPTPTPTNTATPTNTPTPTPLPGNCQAVSWTNLSGVSANGNTITKTDTDYAWDDGATSTQVLWKGAGYVQMTANSTSGHVMFGFNSDHVNGNYDEIDFALELRNGTGIRCYENGTLVCDETLTYSVGDVFKVAVEIVSGGENPQTSSLRVRWYRNGTALYTDSSPTVNYPLLVDSSIYTPGAQVYQAYLCADAIRAASEMVSWTSLTGVDAVRNTITRSASGSSWDKGAVSVATIPSGYTGYVEAVVDSTAGWKMFGLSNGNTDGTYGDIDFAVELQDGGGVRCYESGTLVADQPTSYAVGDVFRVAVVYDGTYERNVVRWYKNGTAFYTNTNPTITFPLLVDSSIYSNGTKVYNAYLVSISGSSRPGSAPPAAGPNKAPPVPAGRPQAPASTTTRTLYVGGLYEEELGTSPLRYVSYYHLGGKLVGMRRVNQADGQNGQYRIAGDHLGSTTLIVDVSNGSNVVQRQYHKPYGEVAWQYTSSGSSLTSVNFTGQRLDTDSGLLYYNARFYDPILSHFVSADAVAPNPIAPLSRDKYGYVQNNPLRYNDPTGHRPAEPDNYEKCQAGYQKACNAELSRYGVELEGEWEAWMLALALQAIVDLTDTAQWSPAQFKSAMGITDGGRLVFKYQAEPSAFDQGFGLHHIGVGVSPDNPAFINRSFDNTTTIEFHKLTFFTHEGTRRTGLDTKSTFVHELGHAWDYASNKELSRGMVTATGGSVTIGYGWRPGESPMSTYGKKNPEEDFAETVMNVVYGDQYEQQYQARIQAATKHRTYLEANFKEYRK